MSSPYERLKKKSEDLFDRATRVAGIINNLDESNFSHNRTSVFIGYISEEGKNTIATALMEEEERCAAEAKRIKAKLDAVNDLLAGEPL